MGQSSEGDLLSWLFLAKTLARQAGALILKYQQESVASNLTRKESSNIDGATSVLGIERKSNSTDLVTKVDLASQELIFSGLRSKIPPSHRLIGEEDGDSENDQQTSLDERPTWIVDAVDGTTNFVHGLRDYAVSIGLAIDRQVMIGVVYSPANDEMFVGLRGYGAYLNDIPMRVSGCNALKEALIVSEWGYERSRQGIDTMLAVNRRFLDLQTRGVRQIGSGSLDMCYVAAGRIDAVYCGVAGGDAWKIWDYAAASLIAEEAGAKLRTVRGDQFHIEADSMACATPGVINELLDVLKSTDQSK